MGAPPPSGVVLRGAVRQLASRRSARSVPARSARGTGRPLRRCGRGRMEGPARRRRRRARREFARSVAGPSAPRHADRRGRRRSSRRASRARRSLRAPARSTTRRRHCRWLVTPAARPRRAPARPSPPIELYARGRFRGAAPEAAASRRAPRSSSATRPRPSSPRPIREARREARYDGARAQVARALAWNPRSAAVLAAAAEVECAAGEKEKALQYDREALALGGLSVEARAEAGRLALEVGDDALAVSVFDALAAEDPRFAEEAAEARLAFRIANWPDAERQAARSRRLTRVGRRRARLVDVSGGPRRARLPRRRRDRRARSARQPADDPVRRRSACSTVDADTHRARPDAALTRGDAAKLMLQPRRDPVRDVARGLECLKGSPGPWRGSADAIRLAAQVRPAVRIGGAAVGGPEFTRGLDRLRSLLPAGEGRTVIDSAVFRRVALFANLEPVPAPGAVDGRPASGTSGPERRSCASPSPAISSSSSSRGEVKVFVDSPDGREVVLTHLQAGEFFGEMALFDGDDAERVGHGARRLGAGRDLARRTFWRRSPPTSV